MLVLEEEAAVRRVVEIPGPRCELIEDVGLKGAQVATGALQAVDKLIFTQAMDGAWRRRERSDENQPRGIRCIGISIGDIDLLDLSIAAVRDVMGDGFTE